MASLSVSCVTYAADAALLEATLISLNHSCVKANEAGFLVGVKLCLIDNGPDNSNLSLLESIKDKFSSEFTQLKIYTGHGNIGYGKGNNLALLEQKSDYHLILNPDVQIAENAILTAVQYMDANPHVGLLAPDVFGLDGDREYLAKREPSIEVLVARALNIQWLNKMLVKKLANYEYRDKIPAENPIAIELASGCFMFCRTTILQNVGGFDARYFMYFEDFDLSRKILCHASIVLNPKVKIIHYGGGAFNKGLKHIVYFLVSFIKYKLFKRDVRKC